MVHACNSSTEEAEARGSTQAKITIKKEKRESLSLLFFLRYKVHLKLVSIKNKQKPKSSSWRRGSVV